MSVDTDPYISKRNIMVAEQIRARGVLSHDVLRTMEMVPRHRFVPPDMVWAAHDDRPLEIGLGQTISQPYMVAAMTQALEVFPGCRVLEIGTGSGYQAAILEEMGCYVWTVERHLELALSSARCLRELSYRQTHVRVGDGGKGWPEFAPFDRIIITAASPKVPPALGAQVAVGGIIVIPIGSRTVQRLTVIERVGLEDFKSSSLMQCVFVPLLGEEGWAGTADSGPKEA